MSSIPAGVIMIWNGAHASIPSGWDRETALDGKYPKAWGDEDPNVSGGSDTHTHTANTHNHSMNSHSHNCTTTHNSSPAQYSNRADSCIDNHDHGTFAIAGVSGGTLSTEQVTWQAGNSEPPNHEVIFITPPSGYAAIASNMICLWNDGTAPTDWTKCDGTGATPDLTNKYVKGADTGQDAGTTGGGTTHAHTVTHGHSTTNHTHSAKSATPSSQPSRGVPGSKVGSTKTHRHTVNLSATAGTVNNYTDTNAGSSDTVEPAYKKTNFIQNTSGGVAPVKKGMIALWLGSTSAVPIGWNLCDGTEGTPDLRNKFIKCIDAAGEIGDTGGSNTHSHTAVSHTHTATGTHTHSGSTSGPDATLSADSGGDGAGTGTHTHPVTVVTSTTATYASSDLDSGAAVDNQPAYLTAAYIQYAFSVGGGVLLGLV